MSTVRLNVPQEIVDELAIPYEATRGVEDIVLAVDSINFAASVVTLASLRVHAPNLVNAIRNWRMRDQRRLVTLTVKGPGIDLAFELPRNVSKGELLDQLRLLFEEEHGG